MAATRHHLRKLEGVGLVVAQEHGRSVRYFENHGRYDKTWRAVAAASEPGSGRVLEWLRGHAGCTQREVVQALSGSMKRGAVLLRLKRLEVWGLVCVQRRGRVKVYRLALA